MKTKAEEDEYVQYMIALYEDIHGRKPTQEWIDDLVEDWEDVLAHN